MKHNHQQKTKSELCEDSVAGVKLSEQELAKRQAELKTMEKRKVSPRTHLYEQENGWYLVVALPSIEQDTISLVTEGQFLHLRAEGDQNVYSRSFEFPPSVEWGEINAKYKAGILQVSLEKAPAKRQQISIQSA